MLSLMFHSANKGTATPDHHTPILSAYKQDKKKCAFLHGMKVALFNLLKFNE